MTSISDVLDDLPEEIQNAVIKEWRNGSRAVVRQNILDLVKAYERLQQDSDTDSMASLGRILPLY